MKTLSSSAVAFLFNNDKVLLLKRAASRTIAPNVWSGIGGHFEESEINTPLIACYREVLEETGIEDKDIFNLELKYVVLRMARNEIRQHYVYFGKTNKTDIIETKEGDLHWVLIDDMLNRDFTMTFKLMLEHFTSIGNKNNLIYAGVVLINNGRLNINWTVLEDTEKLN